MKKVFSVNPKNVKLQSDCHIEFEPKRSGGIQISLSSKVNSMYGNSIQTTIKEMCDFFDIRNAIISINDFGALPQTIMARFELVVKRAYPIKKDEFLPEFNKKNKYKTSKGSLRRSRLYLPGNTPKLFPNAGLHNPDGIILDLEDSVAHSEKDAARLLVRNTLCSTNFYGSERMVRINQMPMGIDDLKFIVPFNVHVILIPKCESAQNVVDVESEVNRIKKELNIKNTIYFMPIIESALGVVKAFEIAKASENNCALTIGLEDYTADIGTSRTKEGSESFYARSAVVNAAKAAGIQAIDTVFSDVADLDGLRKSVIEAKSLGFEGKGCIHPRQIQVVHQAFAPDESEINRAKLIVEAYKQANKKGLGVVSIGSKMIDAPVVKRALNTLKMTKLGS